MYTDSGTLKCFFGAHDCSKVVETYRLTNLQLTKLTYISWKSELRHINMILCTIYIVHWVLTIIIIFNFIILPMDCDWLCLVVRFILLLFYYKSEKKLLLYVLHSCVIMMRSILCYIEIVRHWRSLI